LKNEHTNVKALVIVPMSATNKRNFLLFLLLLFFTPVGLPNSQGMKKLRYAIQKVQKSSWNEPYSSSSFTKQSCSKMALYR